MNRIKKFYFPICLALLGIGILLLGAWDMQHVSAARFNTWWQAESLPEPMAGATIQCPDQPEVIYMVGGVTTGNQTSNRFYKYDAAQQAGWTRLPDLPIPLRGQAVAC
jgi:hypothetical protein